MMEQRRDERIGCEGFFGRMRGGRRPERDGEEFRGDPRMEGFGPERCGEWGGPHGPRGPHGPHDIHGPHAPHEMREFLMKRFAGMRRGVFDPQGFLTDDAFRVEVSETGEEYLVQAELPGVKKEAVALEHLPGMLTITVAAGDEETPRVRPLYLAHCDEEHIRANCRDGVLEIRIPKSKGRKIEVE